MSGSIFSGQILADKLPSSTPLSSVLPRYHIGVYFTVAKQNWLLQHGICSSMIHRYVRKFLSCILQMTSYRAASAKEMNLSPSFGKFFLLHLKMYSAKVMIMERISFLDWWTYGKKEEYLGPVCETSKKYAWRRSTSTLGVSGKKHSRSVKIVKRDPRSIRTKLSIGGTVEKIVPAFHIMLSEHTNEDAEIGKCKSAVRHIRKLEMLSVPNLRIQREKF